MGTSPSIAAVDVGYGNLKVMARALGASTAPPSAFILPVGAAPVEQAPRLVDGSPDLMGGELVVLPDGTRWVGGVDPLRLSGFVRNTHARYPETSEYLALFYAGLVKLAVDGHTDIPVLVTGVPSSEWGNAHLKSIIAKRFTGNHDLGLGRQVRVGKVMVIAQPMGAYAAWLADDQKRAEGHRYISGGAQSVLVIDVGFYSVDWVLMDGNSLHAGTAGSSTTATSAVLESAAAAISAAHGGVPLSVAKLDSVYRHGEPTLRLGHALVPYLQYIDAAATSLGRASLNEAASAMRHIKDVIDFVILTGGAANLFLPAARQTFKGSDVSVVPDPVMANTRGYLGLAASFSTQLQQKAVA